VAAYSCQGTKIVNVWDFGTGRIPFADYTSDYKSSLTISGEPDGVWADSQPWIPTDERSGLLTHIAMTEKRFVVRADENLTAFLELAQSFC